jgi:hypothetical protein
MSNGEEQRPPGESQESGEQAEESAGESTAERLQITIDKPDPGQIIDKAIKVVTDPVGFYQSMPKSGGLGDPLIFMIALALVSAVLSAILSLFGFGMGGMMVAGLMAIIVVPIFVVIFGFVGAAIAYIIWKLMGSDENYETAYRCVAYTSAVGPVVTVLGIVPYIGTIASSLWPMALLAIASIHVHRRGTQVSWGVFGALGVLLAIVNLGAERASNEMAESLEEMQRMMDEQRQ